ncbi:MAG TPA: shikimate kinase [Thermoplasmata archaeon]|nr:shikimate kinase [Thermoplasmata archaeon]
MNGIGRAWGAITFLNALFTGTGSAMAIDLPVEARIEVHPARPGAGRIDLDPSIDTPLVRRSIERGVERGMGREPVEARLELRSAIPWAKGLKSSSAIPVAIARACSGCFGAPISDAEAARFASEVGISVGLSATGAFDDAYASAAGGIVVTDNRDCRILRHDEPNPDWTTVLWVPRGTHPPSPSVADRFRARGQGVESLARSVSEGRYLATMERNSALVEELLGYAYGDLRTDLGRRGALSSGVSGLGPSLAAVVPKGAAGAVARALPPSVGDVIVAGIAAPPRTGSTRGAG